MKFTKYCLVSILILQAVCCIEIRAKYSTGLESTRNDKKQDFLSYNRVLEAYENRYNKSCKLDIDCESSVLVCIEEKCHHKELFPQNLKEYVGLILLLLVGICSIAAGVGGGSLFVPIQVSFFGFGTGIAVGQSNSQIVLNSMFRYMFAIFSKNPEYPTLPLIDYNTVIVFTPTIIFGSAFGAIQNRLLPDIMILIILALSILCGVIYTQYHYINETKKDSKSKTINEKLLEMSTLKNNENNYSLSEAMIEPYGSGKDCVINPDKDFSIMAKELSVNKSNLSEPQFQTLMAKSNQSAEDIKKMPKDKQFNIVQQHWVQILKIRESNMCPCEKYVIQISCFLLTILATQLQGSTGTESIFGIKKCSVFYWIIAVLYVFVIFCLAFYGSYIVSQEQQLKEVSNWSFRKFDNWTNSKIYFTNIFAVIMSTLTSSSGNDGTFYMYPMFLYYGLNNQAANATAMLMIFWSKLTASLAFWLVGDINLEYLLFIGFCMIIVSIFASIKIPNMVKKMKNPNLLSLMFLIFNVIALAVIVWYLFDPSKNTNIILSRDEFCVN